MISILHGLFDAAHLLDIYLAHAINEGSFFWKVGYFIWDRKNPEFDRDEGINGICGDPSPGLRELYSQLTFWAL
jgi:hypothetical protein